MCVYSLKRVITTQGLTIGLSFIKKSTESKHIMFFCSLKRVIANPGLNKRFPSISYPESHIMYYSLSFQIQQKISVQNTGQDFKEYIYLHYLHRELDVQFYLYSFGCTVNPPRYSVNYHF